MSVESTTHCAGSFGPASSAMAMRYEQLKQAIAVLASSADEQNEHLCRYGFVEPHGNDELALEFEDVFISAPHLHRAGELSQRQMEAVEALNRLLTRWSGQEHADFWERKSLWSDPRWKAVRQVAAEALAAFE